MKTLLLVCTCGWALLLNGCGIFKNLDEMHDATVDMNKKMSETNQGVSNAGATSEELKERIVQGNSADIREDLWKAMKAAPEVESKEMRAGAYFMGLEFMLWDAHGSNDQARLDTLKREGVEEFFTRVNEFIYPDYQTSPASKSEWMMNLYALSIAMHRVNTLVERVWDDLDAPQTSMLTLIKEGLARRTEIAAGTTDDYINSKNIPEYVKIVQEQKTKAVYLLQLRENFMPAIVAANFSHLGDRNKPSFLGVMTFFRSLQSLSREGKALLKHWDAEVDSLSEAELWRMSRIIREAVRTRDFLISIGEKTRIDGQFSKILRNMELPVESTVFQIQGEGDTTYAKRMVNRSQALLEICRYMDAYRYGLTMAQALSSDFTCQDPENKKKN